MTDLTKPTLPADVGEALALFAEVRAHLEALATMVDSLHMVAHFSPDVRHGAGKYLCGEADRMRSTFRDFEGRVASYESSVLAHVLPKK